MGVIFRSVRREADGDGNPGQGGLDTHGEIAIGVIVPVVFLLGGLIYFIWTTERRRRNRSGQEPDKTHPSMLQDFLRRKNAFRGSRLFGEAETGQKEHSSSEKDHKDRHELGDTSFHHELEDATSPIYEVEKPAAIHPARRDSAINSPVELDSPSPLPLTQATLEQASKQPIHTSTTTELPSRDPNEVRQSTISSTFRHSLGGTGNTTRYSAVSPPSSWRASLQPTSFLGNFSNKRDRRVSKAASSRYSQQEEGFTMMEPHSRRQSAINETESPASTINSARFSAVDPQGHKKRVSDDSDTISPPASNQLSRTPSAQRASVALSPISSDDDAHQLS